MSLQHCTPQGLGRIHFRAIEIIPLKSAVLQGQGPNFRQRPDLGV
jgi:hypothetical protein